MVDQTPVIAALVMFTDSWRKPSGGPRKWHVVRDGRVACAAGLGIPADDTDPDQEARDIAPESRCKRAGCAERWPAPEEPGDSR